ncbi:Breast cancer type 2 susceptibility [Gossypium arboreum]|uniref:Breast cancer type 2 susceptibility n=1 Tax=Gossypium arboreum TaxID=29729 RepID=A0A0B0P9I0_GOSAR|nr:Breast cancer type 2 susceptibility [Gossypium arboreum]
MAFRCIKGDGGPVPLTLVGVTRIYPVLYRERLRNGGSIVRSERMESRMVQKHNQRCSVLVDHVISEYQRGVNSSHIHNDSESEGAKILRILETSAEPEVLMAEMSPEQLTSFATYKSKLEATRQLEMEKSIEKALAEAGLNERDVVPFMRVRVVGLINRNYHGKGRPKEGIITIWNPTEKQECELVEGQAYVVSGLIPMNSDSEILYLQARGSTNKWQPLSPLAMESFEAFFCPRKSMKLSNLGEISLSSEFDIAAYVVYVGEVYTASHQKKQWVFVTDDSISDLQSDSLLAISFCSPSIDDDSFAPINPNLVGSMVGFCNLIKKPKDQMNHLWVAEATENSTYYLNFKPSISHLQSAGASVQAWAKASSSIIDELRKKLKLEIEQSFARVGIQSLAFELE